MIEIFLNLIFFILIGIFSISSIVFLITAIVKYKKSKSYKISLGLFALFGLLALLIFNIDLNSAEATDRKDSVSAFESNFGFMPPQNVEEIKHKNFAFYDTRVHWISFTYDQKVLDKIIAHDNPLKVAISNSSEFIEIVENIEKSAHNPKWLELPDIDTKQIYYKRDFLEKSLSEYYLWTNKDIGMTYLFVHYFD